MILLPFLASAQLLVAATLSVAQENIPETQVAQKHFENNFTFKSSKDRDYPISKIVFKNKLNTADLSRQSNIPLHQSPDAILTSALLSNAPTSALPSSTPSSFAVSVTGWYQYQASIGLSSATYLPLGLGTIVSGSAISTWFSCACGTGRGTGRQRRSGSNGWHHRRGKRRRNSRQCRGRSHGRSGSWNIGHEIDDWGAIHIIH